MTAPEYKFRIADCDVLDKKRLEAFRSKRLDWLNSMRYDPHHSINTTIAEMVWSDTRFRAFSAIGEGNPDSALNNSLIAEAIIEGHFATQALAIRRLMDGTKSVISLTNVLKEIRGNIDLFTRENFVAYDGLPYDYARAMQASAEKLARCGGPYWQEREGPSAWFPSDMAHELFDRLAGIAPEARTREDRIPVRPIETLQELLDASDAVSIVEYADNFLAHARDSRRRGEIDTKTIQPTLAKITNACRCFVRVSEAILAFILNDSGHGQIMPTAQFDLWKNMDSPAMPESFTDNAQAEWDRLSKERDQYLDEVREEWLAK